MNEPFEWHLSKEELPTGEEQNILCLCICREQDIIDKRWIESVQVISYSTVYKEWNTRSIYKIVAWAYLMPAIEKYLISVGGNADE